MLSLRPIEAGDDDAVAHLIRTVMPEFGADGPGFAIHDAEVAAMHATYSRDGSCYLVVVDPDNGAEVVGGGGIAPLSGGEPGTCELRKMYFHKHARGRGAGRLLLGRLLEEAKARDYSVCYLETLTGMDAAQHLYAAMGFEKLCGPMGKTGHFACDRFFAKKL